MENKFSKKKLNKKLQILHKLFFRRKNKYHPRPKSIIPNSSSESKPEIYTSVPVEFSERPLIIPGQHEMVDIPVEVSDRKTLPNSVESTTTYHHPSRYLYEIDEYSDDDRGYSAPVAKRSNICNNAFLERPLIISDQQERVDISVEVSDRKTLRNSVESTTTYHHPSRYLYEIDEYPDDDRGYSAPAAKRSNICNNAVLERPLIISGQHEMVDIPVEVSDRKTLPNSVESTTTYHHPSRYLYETDEDSDDDSGYSTQPAKRSKKHIPGIIQNNSKFLLNNDSLPTHSLTASTETVDNSDTDDTYSPIKCDRRKRKILSKQERDYANGSSLIASFVSELKILERENSKLRAVIDFMRRENERLVGGKRKLSELVENNLDFQTELMEIDETNHYQSRSHKFRKTNNDEILSLIERISLLKI